MQNTESTRTMPPPQQPRAEASLAVLHAAMLLSGFGTVFLGPALPALVASAGVNDTGSGLFFTAQFAGAFLGGVTTNRRLSACLLRGLAVGAVGFGLLALCAHLHARLAWDALSLLLIGFGVGQTLTSVNLLASERFRETRTTALSLVNFSWSLGAVTAPFLLGSALSKISLSTALTFVSILFGLALLFTALSSPRGFHQTKEDVRETTYAGLSRHHFLVFGAMLLLYGGVETALSGWITTFGTRYGSSALRISSLGATALWIGITGGRALTPVILRWLRENALLAASLTAASCLVLLLSQASGAGYITLLALLLGLALAPWFPLVLSAMLSRGSSPRETGLIIAVSGIGAAVLPLLLGVVSHRTGSLRIALAVPLAGLVALLLLALSLRSGGPAKSV